MSPFSQNRGTHLEVRAAHLAHVHLMSVFACGGTICGEDSCAVAVGVPVDHADGIVQGVCLQNHQHWPKDLLSVALHLRLRAQRTLYIYATVMQILTACPPCTHKTTYCDIADDGGSHKVAVRVTFDLHISAVQQQRCSFIHSALDQTADSLFGLGRDQRPHVCTRLVS